MNLQIIKTYSYWLLADSEAEPKYGKYVLIGTALAIIGEAAPDLFSGEPIVLAHLPIGAAPLLEGVPVLPELPKQEEDVELTLEDFYYNEEQYRFYKSGKHRVVNKLKAASQGKMYSREDILKWYKHVKTHTVEEAFAHLESLSPVQEQEWVFEPELEPYDPYDPRSKTGRHESQDDRRILTIPNSESPNNPILTGKWIKK